MGMIYVMFYLIEIVTILVIKEEIFEEKTKWWYNESDKKYDIKKKLNKR